MPSLARTIARLHGVPSHFHSSASTLDSIFNFGKRVRSSLLVDKKGYDAISANPQAHHSAMLMKLSIHVNLLLGKISLIQLP